MAPTPWYRRGGAGSAARRTNRRGPMGLDETVAGPECRGRPAPNGARQRAAVAETPSQFLPSERGSRRGPAWLPWIVPALILLAGCTRPPPPARQPPPPGATSVPDDRHPAALHGTWLLDARA